MVQLSHLYMIIGKTIALTIGTFVGKVMSLLFKTLSRFNIAILPRSKHFNFITAVTIHIYFGVQEDEIWHCFRTFLIYFFELMGLDTKIFIFECWVLSQLFHSPLSLLSRGSLVPFHFLPLGVICISEVINIFPCNLGSSVSFIQPSISHNGVCMEVKQTGYSFPRFEPVHCSMSISNCCFLTCLQIS